jgi:predicted dehydrogenase
VSSDLKYAMIGGGTGSFIGAVHRMAIALDGSAKLVAGAFSSTAERSKESATALGVAPDRAYADFNQLAEVESQREDRPDFVVIVTPNHVHYEAARACLEAGLNVVCDKPFTLTSQQAAELRDLAAASNLLCAVSYNYSGYPMVREAAELVRSGAIGKVRKCFVEYHQGWLATNLEATGQKQASWRTDPAKAGLGGALGDIGTHAEHLLRFITGLDIESLCADTTSFVPGRVLDDDASVLMRLSGGSKATLTASQIATGEANGFSIRIYAETGGLIWKQETPEQLIRTSLNGSKTILSRGTDPLSTRASTASRLPSGHPEGFIEAFANIYRGVAEHILCERNGAAPGAMALQLPRAEDGRRGIRFVEACVQSAKAGSNWVTL